MHAHAPPRDLTSLLPVGKFHIYAIGSEECENSIAKSIFVTLKKRWEAQLTSTLGSEYVKLGSQILQAIHLIVFVHKSLMPVVSGTPRHTTTPLHHYAQGTQKSAASSAGTSCLSTVWLGGWFWLALAAFSSQALAFTMRRSTYAVGFYVGRCTIAGRSDGNGQAIGQ